MRLRIAGHPLHPAVVHFPLALWLTAVLWDVVAWWQPEPLWRQMAYWCLALGCIAAVPAALTGFVELVGLRADKRAAAVATTHMMLMLTATFAFGASFILRTQDAVVSSPWSVLLSFAGAALLTIGGWLGGTLVYRHGIGTAMSEDS